MRSSPPRPGGASSWSPAPAGTYAPSCLPWPAPPAATSPYLVVDAGGRFDPQPPAGTVSRPTQSGVARVNTRVVVLEAMADNAHPKAKEIYATLPAGLVRAMPVGVVVDAKTPRFASNTAGRTCESIPTTTQLHISPNSPKGACMPRAVTAPPDPGALSGLVAGLSFIGGLGGANALDPEHRPASF